MRPTKLAMGPVDPHITTQLHQRIPTFKELQSVTRQPAISIGVLHNGHKIFTYNNGRKDVDDDGSCPDEDTLYCIASLSKQLIAGAMTTLVADGRLAWNTRLSTILPGFSNASDGLVGERATVKDILSHRSGLSSLDILVQGISGKVNLDKSEITHFARALPASSEFRSTFRYCNMGYSLAGEVIERVSGQPWPAVVSERVLTPLQMKRTFCYRGIHKEDQNVAKTYNVLSDGSTVEVPISMLDGDHVNGAAGGIRSTVHDVLRWAKALMSNTSSPFIVDHEDDSHANKSADSYLNVSVPKIAAFADILNASVIVDPAAPSEHNYGMGIVRQSTPAILGTISPNRSFTNPVMGSGSPSMKVFSHHGNFDGATCSLYMFPQSSSAVVVLSNAKGRSDATDWIAQDIIQTIFGLSPYVDVLREAHSCRAGYDSWFRENIEAPLANKRQVMKGAPSVKDFIGKYLLRGYKDFKLVITGHDIETQKLVMLVNGKQSQRHVLSHYHFDTWNFAPSSYDAFIRGGYGPYEAAEEFLLVFQRQSNGEVTSLKWRMQGDDVLFTKSSF